MVQHAIGSSPKIGNKLVLRYMFIQRDEMYANYKEHSEPNKERT
jgi:hypothetical protein